MPGNADPKAGRLRDTYHAAIQHDLVDLSGDERLIGVARRPPAWFHGYVEENVADLGPPPDLLDDFYDRAEALAEEGRSDVAAHNAAWDAVDYERRYHAHLDSDPDARAGMDRLLDLLADGETVVLVCFENEDKYCHRRLLKARLNERR